MVGDTCRDVLSGGQPLARWAAALLLPPGMGKWDLNHAGVEAGLGVQKWLITIFMLPLPFPSLAQGQG